MRKEKMIEAEQHLKDAANSLRYAWKLFKNEVSFERTTKDIAATILDIEAAAEDLNNFNPSQE